MGHVAATLATRAERDSCDKPSGPAVRALLEPAVEVLDGEELEVVLDGGQQPALHLHPLRGDAIGDRAALDPEDKVGDPDGDDHLQRVGHVGAP